MSLSLEFCHVTQLQNFKNWKLFKKWTLFAPRNWAVSYYLTLEEVSRPLRLEKPERLLQFVIIKCWKSFRGHWKIFYWPIIISFRSLVGPRARKTKIMAINVKKFENNWKKGFYQKFAELRDNNKLKTISITTRNYVITYYQTLEELPCHLGLKSSKTIKNSKNLKKNCRD